MNMDDSDRQFLAQCFADMKLDHRLRTEKLSEAFCKMLDRQRERIAFLETVAWQAFSVDQEIPERYVELRQWIEERKEKAKAALESREAEKR